MPRYFFHVRQDKDFVEDSEGVECTDSGHAKAEAIEGACDLMAEHILKGLDVSDWSYEIVDEDGRLVMTVPFAEAIQ